MAAYANGNATRIARLKLLYPNHPVPFTPVAHIERSSVNIGVCPGNNGTDRAQRIALHALARTAMWRAPTCYAPVESNGDVKEAQMDDASSAKVFVSERHHFVFLGLHLGVDEAPRTKSGRLDASKMTKAELFALYREVRTRAWHDRRHQIAQNFLDRPCSPRPAHRCAASLPRSLAPSLSLPSN